MSLFYKGSEHFYSVKIRKICAVGWKCKGTVEVWIASWILLD